MKKWTLLTPQTRRNAQGQKTIFAQEQILDLRYDPRNRSLVVKFGLWDPATWTVADETVKVFEPAALPPPLRVLCEQLADAVLQRLGADSQFSGPGTVEEET